MQALRIVRRLREDLVRYGIGPALHDVGRRAVNILADFQILKGMTARLRDVNDPSLFEAPGFHGRFVPVGELARTYGDSHELASTFLREANLRGDRWLCALRWRHARILWLVLRPAEPDR